MKDNEIRNPIQKRSIEKKEKIIKCGFELICEKGYHNTNTAEIAKAAQVSTGIVYQYFKDKRDILLQGMEQYAKSLMFPITDFSNRTIDINNLENEFKKLINHSIKNHNVSKSAHEEILSLKHSDYEIAEIFNNYELETTNKLEEFFRNNNIITENLKEKSHLIYSMIDDLCHEVVYHKHNDLDYSEMTNLVIKSIINLLK